MNNSTYTLGIIELFYPPRHLDLLNVHSYQRNKLNFVVYYDLLYLKKLK